MSSEGQLYTEAAEYPRFEPVINESKYSHLETVIAPLWAFFSDKIEDWGLADRGLELDGR